MSAAELVHRIVEQGRRWLDQRRSWGWARFAAAGGALRGFPAFDLAALTPELAETARREAKDAISGRFEYLGTKWPPPKAADWWRSNFWLVDPVSGTNWPGRESFAYNVSYRHEMAKGDVKFVWELNRLQFLQAMAIAAAADGSDEAAALVWDMVDGWMEQNPPYQGVNWTSGIEAASRLLSVLLALAALPMPAAQVRARLLAFVEAHAYWLERYPSLHSSANNHRVSEVAALFVASLCAPEAPTPERAGSEARAALEMEIRRQFHRDGVGAEQSPTYSAYSLEWFCLAGAAADAVGQPFSPEYRARAARAAEHLHWLLDEGGAAPAIGDDDEGRVVSLTQAPERNHVASVVALSRRWLGVSQLPAAMREPTMRDLVAPAVGQPAELLSGARSFIEGGYSVLRRPRPDGLLLLVFDHAPLGFLSIAAHGHADALSVWLHWGDEPVLVDAGTYLYHSGGAWRDRFRSTLAHNTLAVEDRDQSRIAGPFAWSAHAQTRLVAGGGDRWVAEHDGYRAEFGLVHRRTVVFEQADTISIEDQLLGRSTRARLAWSLGYTLHPDVRVEVVGAEARLQTAAGRCLTMVAEACDSAPWTVEDGLYSPRFNCRVSTRRLVLRGVAATQTVARTRIRLDDRG